MKTILVQRLYEHIAQIDPKKELIIDVRTPTEYAEGHIPGAVNRPLDEIERHVDEFNEYETVYVHCRGGGRSARACEILNGKGLHRAVNVEGGAMAWVDAGYELEK